MMGLRSYLQFALTLALAFHPAVMTAQSKVEQTIKTNRVVRCVIYAERSDWKPTEPAVIAGEIENAFDGPLEIKVVPVLYLSSTTSDALRDRYWSPVDLFHDAALSTDRQAIDPKATVISIKSRSILLQFKKKGDIVKFKLDARHTLWDRQISSVWPSRSLFSVIESGVYNLQLVLEADEGNSESRSLRIQIDSLKSEKK
jgi:hypothetical protein